jgi:hypothetical protein
MNSPAEAQVPEEGNGGPGPGCPRRPDEGQARGPCFGPCCGPCQEQGRNHNHSPSQSHSRGQVRQDWPTAAMEAPMPPEAENRSYRSARVQALAQALEVRERALGAAQQAATVSPQLWQQLQRLAGLS